MTSASAKESAEFSVTLWWKSAKIENDPSSADMPKRKVATFYGKDAIEKCDREKAMMGACCNWTSGVPKCDPCPSIFGGISTWCEPE